MRRSLCICDEIRKVDVRSHLCVVMHRDEAIKTTNTGSLAARILTNSSVMVHGQRGATLPSPDMHGRRGLVLFPSSEAKPLDAATHAPRLTGTPVTLFVPDGTWRQATKMGRRVPWLLDMEPVCLPEGGAETAYHLRRETKNGGLATAEAIARAFGVLEGLEVQRELERVFRLMVERTLFSRGLLARESVAGGLPDAVAQHRPA